MTTLEIVLIVALLLSWSEYIRVMLCIRRILKIIDKAQEELEQLREDTLELVESAAVLEQERNK